MTNMSIVRVLSVLFGIAVLLNVASFDAATQSQDCRDANGRPIECPPDDDDSDNDDDTGNGTAGGSEEHVDLAESIALVSQTTRNSITLALSDAALRFGIQTDPFSLFYTSTQSAATFASVGATNVDPDSGGPFDVGLIYLKLPNNDAGLGQSSRGDFYRLQWEEQDDGLVRLSFINDSTNWFDHDSTTVEAIPATPEPNDAAPVQISAAMDDDVTVSGWTISVWVKYKDGSWVCVIVKIRW